MESIIAIILLTLAILPMVSMFDMGLHGVTANSHYDKARTLANLKLEQAKSLPFADVENNFPAAGNTTPYNGLGPAEPDFPNFQYTVKKDYMQEWNPTNQDATRFFQTSGATTNLIRVTVTVQWSDGDNTNTFTTSGLVAR